MSRDHRVGNEMRDATGDQAGMRSGAAEPGQRISQQANAESRHDAGRFRNDQRVKLHREPFLAAPFVLRLRRSRELTHLCSPKLTQAA